MQRRPPGQLQAVNQTIVLVTSGDNPSPSFEKERKEHANATCFSLFLSFQHHQTISQCHIISSSPHQRLGQLLQTLRVTLQDLRGLPSHGNGASLPNHGASTGLSFNAETGKHGKQLSHRIHACYIYGNIYHQDTPVMLAYIYIYPYMDPIWVWTIHRIFPATAQLVATSTAQVICICQGLQGLEELNRFLRSGRIWGWALSNLVSVVWRILKDIEGQSILNDIEGISEDGQSIFEWY